MINQTVSSQVDAIKPLPTIHLADEGFADFSKKIINKQKTNPRYDYASKEQLEIDRLVYEAYGLNEDDIREVENWYARRYPALVSAQSHNLGKNS